MDNKKLVNSNFKGVSITAHSGDSLTQKEQLGRGGQILGRVNLPSGQIISSSDKSVSSLKNSSGVVGGSLAAYGAVGPHKKESRSTASVKKGANIEMTKKPNPKIEGSDSNATSSRTDFIKKVIDRFEAKLKANKVRATKTGRK